MCSSGALKRVIHPRHKLYRQLSMLQPVTSILAQHIANPHCRHLQLIRFMRIVWLQAAAMRCLGAPTPHQQRLPAAAASKPPRLRGGNLTARAQSVTVYFREEQVSTEAAPGADLVEVSDAAVAAAATQHAQLHVLQQPAPVAMDKETQSASSNVCRRSTPYRLPCFERCSY